MTLKKNLLKTVRGKKENLVTVFFLFVQSFLAFQKSVNHLFQLLDLSSAEAIILTLYQTTKF